MSGMHQITVTLPANLLTALRTLTDDVPTYAAEAVARQIRRDLAADDLQRYQQQHGHFTAAELAEADERIFGAP